MTDLAAALVQSIKMGEIKLAALVPVDLLRGKRTYFQAEIFNDPKYKAALTNPDQFQAILQELQGESGLLVGKYGEERQAMLVGSRYEAEGRTIHLGLDLLLAPGTAIFAAFAGQVVASAQEDKLLGYGNYLLLEHRLGERKFYTFYGHLATAERAKLGRAVLAGEAIATIGDSKQNGGWPSHLHFQLCTEFPPAGHPPGYVSKQDFAKLAALYPDPSFIIDPAWR
ncbi:MAG: hypothetical protein A2788_01800 [Candidatus Abawacabacteria bacterium RIFCSPHIGHO2_01_FULL_46_8]|uniref:M23ase beta-sheet core domain-containing protein n=1 Tax=Candidatus Abawacabacteria bacterium RIFCSPHIGHO2_01_FULL_46_8 TaxID=1817815 RepID=A0A1F4XIW4_9BACT|nr:MAG: hypothetical protein A2788_01800 [Candidatus Abawacabacteria bacterium RIFCSPHIGHO2_01_FULL_46_8]